MPSESSNTPLHVGVILGDPRLPYPFAENGRFGEEEHEGARQLKIALAQLEGYRFSYFDDHKRLIDDLRTTPLDLVFNLCDTGFCNRWEQARNVPALLELLELPYTGADPMCHDLTSDKAVVKSLAVDLGVRVPEEIFVDLSEEPFKMPPRYPAIIKPNAGGGSFGVSEESLVHDQEQAERLMRWLAKKAEPPHVVVQDFLPGTEYTVGMIGNVAAGLTMLPPSEIDYADLDDGLPQIFTYDAKFAKDSPYGTQLHHRRATLEPADLETLEEGCGRVFRRVGMRDYARFDWRAGADGELYLIDANPNPTWYHDSRMAMMAGWQGIDYPGLLRIILDSAVTRYGLRQSSS